MPLNATAIGSKLQRPDTIAYSAAKRTKVKHRVSSALMSQQAPMDICAENAKLRAPAIDTGKQTPRDRRNPQKSNPQIRTFVRCKYTKDAAMRCRGSQTTGSRIRSPIR